MKDAISATARLTRFTTNGLLVFAVALGAGIARGQGQSQFSDSGPKLFDSYCTACHQYDDQGMGEAPPLDDSPWVIGPAGRLIRIILHGVEGPIKIGGKIYDREMPGFGGVLSDCQVATLATYARTRFGAKAPKVTPEEVERVCSENAGRKSYWRANELLEIR